MLWNTKSVCVNFCHTRTFSDRLKSTFMTLSLWLQQHLIECVYILDNSETSNRRREWNKHEKNITVCKRHLEDLHNHAVTGNVVLACKEVIHKCKQHKRHACKWGVFKYKIPTMDFLQTGVKTLKRWVFLINASTFTYIYRLKHIHFVKFGLNM